MNLSPHRKFVLTVTAILVAGFTAAADAGTVMVKLEGMGSTRDYGYGSRGLYLGDDWNNMSGHTTNWKWEKPNVLLTIFENGDAQIKGTMTRYYNHEEWGFTIDLKGLKKANSHEDAEFSMDMLKGPNEGYDWAELMLTLDYDGNSKVPRDGWVGYAMPDIGHLNVAEIRTDENGKIRFDAWYKHLLPTIEVKDWGWYKDEDGDWQKGWHFDTVVDRHHADYDGHKCYNVGDTKAWGWLMEPPDETPEIPAPAALPAGLALLGLGLVRRNRKSA